MDKIKIALKDHSKKRCSWCLGDPIYIKYHDKEWGKPVRNDKKLFEFITLEGAQAGLSWLTILKKREGYRKAFADFNVEKIARFSSKKIESLLKNPEIIRNRLKVASTVTNAQAFIEIQKEFGSFSKYQWSFVDNKPVQNQFRKHSQIPAKTDLSDKISKDLKKRGFKFVGSTIIYAHLQATGVVSDHTKDCFRHSQLS